MFLISSKIFWENIDRKKFQKKEWTNIFHRIHTYPITTMDDETVMTQAKKSRNITKI